MDHPPSPPEGIPAPSDISVPVVLYTTPWCGFCRAALALLKQLDIEHHAVNVEGQPGARRWIQQMTHRATVPQIFVWGQSIGGYTELAALERSGELDRLLADRPAP